MLEDLGAMAAAAPDHGVARAPRPLQLTDVDLRGEVVDRDISMLLQQTFVNPTGAAVTADYFFPLTAGVAVFQVEAAITDAPGAVPRIIRATVREKQEARMAYESAVAAGREAVLLERSQESEDVFKLGVGNVPAGARVVVTIGFLTESIATASEARPGAAASRIVIARHLLHRYAPAYDRFREDASALGAWSVESAVAAAAAAAGPGPASPLRVSLTVLSPVSLASIASPSHSAAICELSEAHGRRKGTFTLPVAHRDWVDDSSAASGCSADVHIVIEEASGGELSELHASADLEPAAETAASRKEAVPVAVGPCTRALVALEAAVIPEDPRLKVDSPREAEGGTTMQPSLDGFGLSVEGCGAERLLRAAPPTSTDRVGVDRAAVAGAHAATAASDRTGSRAAVASRAAGECKSAEPELAALDAAGAITVAVTVTPALAEEVIASSGVAGSTAGSSSASGSPPDAAAACDSEYVFVLDKSGSMDGPRMEAARQALRAALQSLPSGCRFGVVAFDHTFSALMRERIADGSGGYYVPFGSAGLVPHNAATIAEATRLLDQLTADGGTELLDVVRACCIPDSDAGATSTGSTAAAAAVRDGPPPSHLPVTAGSLVAAPLAWTERHVLLFTDGEVSNTREVIALAASAAAEARGRLTVHTFGIGSGVSTSLVNGLARATGGAAEFIADGEAFEGKVNRILQLTRARKFVVSADWSPQRATGSARMPSRHESDPLTAAEDGGLRVASGTSGVTMSASTEAGGCADPIPGLPQEATVSCDPVRLFAVLRKDIGPGSTAAVLAAASFTFRDVRSGKSVSMPLLRLPAPRVVNTNSLSRAGCTDGPVSAGVAHPDVSETQAARALTAPTAAATAFPTQSRTEMTAAETSHSGPRYHGQPHAQAGALTLRAVQAAIRELEAAEDMNTVADAGGASAFFSLHRDELPADASNAATYFRKQASSVSIRWGILCRHTAFMGQADDPPPLAAARPLQLSMRPAGSASSTGGPGLGACYRCVPVAYAHDDFSSDDSLSGVRARSWGHSAAAFRLPVLAAQFQLPRVMPVADSSLAMALTGRAFTLPVISECEDTVRVLGVLGIGRTGVTVHAALRPPGGHSASGRAEPSGPHVAIKVLRTSAISDWHLQAQLLSGAIMAAHVAQQAGRHPGLMPLLGAIQLRDRGVGTVHEFCPGGDLESRLLEPSDAGSPWAERLGYALQIANVLAYLHSVGVVHGDLMLRHLFLDREGKVKLQLSSSTRLLRAAFSAMAAEHGVVASRSRVWAASSASEDAAADRSASVTGGSGHRPTVDSALRLADVHRHGGWASPIHSPGEVVYMAPELLADGGPSEPALRFRCTPESDVYALGIVLWQLMTRRRPYSDARQLLLPLQCPDARGGSPLHPEERHAYWRGVIERGNRPSMGDGVIDPDAPSFLPALVEACWAADPAKRPSAAQVLAALHSAR